MNVPSTNPPDMSRESLRPVPRQATSDSDLTAASTLNQCGHALAARRRFPAAESCFRLAIELNPTFAMAHNNLGWVRGAQGNRTDAQLHYRRALEIDPRLRLARRNLRALFIGARRYDELLHMYRGLLSRDPFDLDALSELSDALRSVGDIAAAVDCSRLHATILRGNAFGAPEHIKAPQSLSRSQLRHDIEQFRYLRARGLLGDEFDVIVRRYEEVVATIPDAPNWRAPLTADQQAAIGDVYQRIVYLRPTPRHDTSTLSSAWDREAAERDYREDLPGVLVIDDLLSGSALADLRAFCLESTIWSLNRYVDGRLGSFLNDGFACPLLGQIAEDLGRALPNIIRRHPLRQMWGFKHDQETGRGVDLHADFAAINVNFWLTPDEANLDPAGGGLVVHYVEAPLDWDFRSYNEDVRRLERYVASRAARTRIIPYRSNRAIIFNSDLISRSCAAAIFGAGSKTGEPTSRCCSATAGTNSSWGVYS